MGMENQYFLGLSTIKKRICLWGVWLILICVEVGGSENLLMTEKVQAKEQLSLHAHAALLMDASSGRVLFSQNGDEVLPNASTTKIMTCILALEYMEKHPEQVKNTPVTVSGYAARMPKVKLGLQEGEQYNLSDLLYSLMLESHNDTAVAIAEYIAGDVDSFADRMNEKARELGCENTFFVTPNGLDKERDGRWHSTTAHDLAEITAYALKNEAFREIIKTPSYSFSEITKGRSFCVSNKDGFLSQMEGAIGVKTGFTGKAGYCFVGALEREGKSLISVVLASGWPPDKTWKWADTKKLMEYGLEHFHKTNLAELEETKKKQLYLDVENGTEEKAMLKYQNPNAEELTLLLCDTDTIHYEVSAPERLCAPVKENTIVGYQCYYLNGDLYKKYPILTTENIPLRTYFYCMRQIFVLYF